MTVGTGTENRQTHYYKNLKYGIFGQFIKCSHVLTQNPHSKASYKNPLKAFFNKEFFSCQKINNVGVGVQDVPTIREEVITGSNSLGSCRDDLY